MLQNVLQTMLMVISVLLIAVVLLQSSKASDSSQILTGGNDVLFQERKERGFELFISRFTLVLGIAFFVVAFILYII